MGLSLSGWIVLVSSVIGLLLIIFVPRIVFRPSLSSKYADRVELAKNRNGVRVTIAQIVAGFAFVATFIQTAYNFNQDFKQKTQQNTADLFAKAAFEIDTAEDNAWKTMGALHVLANVASVDPGYHEQVFSYLTHYVVKLSQDQCSPGVLGKPSHKIDGRLQTATRIIATRKVDNDPTLYKFNLEESCWVAGQYLETSLSHLYLPRAQMMKADFRRVSVKDTDLRGISAGIDKLPSYKEFPNNNTNWALEKMSNDRYSLIANFEAAQFDDVRLDGAGLAGANFQGARFKNTRLAGADLRAADLRRAEFSRGSSFHSAELTGANIAGAVFKDVDGLTGDQLVKACVRVQEDDDDAEPLRQNFPTVSGRVQFEVEELGGYRLCK